MSLGLFLSLEGSPVTAARDRCTLALTNLVGHLNLSASQKGILFDAVFALVLGRRSDEERDLMLSKLETFYVVDPVLIRKGVAELGKFDPFTHLKRYIKAKHSDEPWLIFPRWGFESNVHIAVVIHEPVHIAQWIADRDYFSSMDIGVTLALETDAYLYERAVLQNMFDDEFLRAAQDHFPAREYEELRQQLSAGGVIQQGKDDAYDYFTMTTQGFFWFRKYRQDLEPKIVRYLKLRAQMRFIEKLDAAFHQPYVEYLKHMFRRYKDLHTDTALP